MADDLIRNDPPVIMSVTISLIDQGNGQTGTKVDLAGQVNELVIYGLIEKARPILMMMFANQTQPRVQPANGGVLDKLNRHLRG